MLVLEYDSGCGTFRKLIVAATKGMIPHTIITDVTIETIKLS